MKKNLSKLLTKLLIGSLILQLFPIQANATFSDVPSTYKNYEAITYLEENNILEGYSDGTFRPENPVNRVEFLKIIIEGSSIPKDVLLPTPFTDIDHTLWYAPYVKKAYASTWINGYPDGTYRPEQTINKVEALKILGEVQDWQVSEVTTPPFSDTPLSEWYTKYVSFAKSQGYLEETGTIFNPSELMTRAAISEIIYKTITNPPTTAPETTEPTLPPETTAPETSTIEQTQIPYSFNLFSNDFYDNLILEEDFPNIFYKNEVYVFEGQTTLNDVDIITAFLDPEDSDPDNYIIFDAEIKNNHFHLPIYFNESGNYNLGLLPGNSGSTKLIDLSVISALPTSSDIHSPPSVSNTNIKFEDDITSVEFTVSSTPSLKRVNLAQNSNNISYLSRQNLNKIPLNYRDFKNFTEGTVTYNVEAAKISSTSPLEITSTFQNSISKTFTPTEHTFSTIIDEKITASPPDTLPSAKTITFSGQVKTDTQLLTYIIKPNGSLDKATLQTSSPTSEYYGNEIINSGGSYTFSYTPATSGRYIIEINDKEGLPIVNHTVYIGTKIPLLPDFFDLNQREFFTGTVNLTSERSALLELINSDRNKAGLSSLTLNTDLSLLAQSHSEDMRDNNFFSHINPAGETPEDRRILAGIVTPTSENIAKDVSVEFAHEGLMRSGSHRENILDPDWTQVGFGIVKDNEGYLYITEEFSRDKLTQADLDEMKTELITEINNTRSSNGLSTLSYSTNLENVSRYLNNKEINEGLTLTTELFGEALSTYAITGSSQAIGRTFDEWEEILNSIIEEESSILGSSWTKIGVDIQTDSMDIIHTIFTLNDN